MSKCSDCDKPAWARGFCGTHYARWRRNGDAFLRKIAKYNTVCTIDGCATKAKYGGLCGKHAQRKHRYGDPLYVTPEEVRRVLSRQAQPTLGKAKPSTYKKLLGRHEHRRVAEEMLGRPLERGEIVHHIDGNKHNNDPSNLQVMTQSEHIKSHRAEMQKARLAARDGT